MTSKLAYILVMVVVIFVFGMLVYEGETAEQATSIALIKANEIMRQYPDGSVLGFTQEPQPPVNEFIYREVEISELVTDPSGTTTVVTTNQTLAVPIEDATPEELISSGYITQKDIQEGVIELCKLGHQCEIEGRMTLVDIYGFPVDPPYIYSILISCSQRLDCTGRQFSANGEFTDPNGGFRYRFTTAESLDTKGDYTAVLQTRSTYANQAGDKTNYVVTGIVRIV